MDLTTDSDSVSTSSNTTVWVARAGLRILGVDPVPTDSLRAGEIVRYRVNASNDAVAIASEISGTGTTFNMSVTIALAPGLRPGGATSNLTTEFPPLPPSGILSVNLKAIVAQNVTPGTSVRIRVLLSYRDINCHPLGPVEGQSSPLYVARTNLLSPGSLLAGAVISLAAILTTLIVLLYASQRKIVIDEAFLMAKGGTLVRHESRQPDSRKDDDRVASMFIAIQEFVRDSFRWEVALDSVAFGYRSAAVVRGELTAFAAITSHGDADAVTPELLAVAPTIETRYWDALRAWARSHSRLEGVDAIVGRLMKGAFRPPWRVQPA